MLFYTGTSRFASAVAADMLAQPRRAPRRAAAHARHGRRGAGDRHRHRRPGAVRAPAARELALEAQPEPDDLRTRRSTRSTRRRCKHGALGGKLLGAGSSGFMCFFVPPHRQAAVLRALAGHLHVPFAFEDEGSRVIHYAAQDTRRRRSGRRELAARQARRAARSTAGPPPAPPARREHRHEPRPAELPRPRRCGSEPPSSRPSSASRRRPARHDARGDRRAPTSR